MHKWHHVKVFPNSHRYGINFGISLSVWDYIFKTAHIPHDAQEIDLGYPGDEEMPGTFTGQAFFPFTRKSKKSAISAPAPDYNTLPRESEILEN